LSNGALTIEGSTIAGNSGGAEALGALVTYRSLSLTNSTVSDDYWGIVVGATVTLAHSTIVGGDAALASLGSGVTTTTKGSLMVGGCLPTDSDVTSKGYNIESPGNTCGFDQGTDQVVPDPMLGPLQDNGGPTETHALLPGSPAINQIPVEDCLDAEGAPLTTDQRGEPRPETGGTMCDVGAFERQTDDP